MPNPKHSDELQALLEPIVQESGLDLDDVLVTNQSGTPLVRVIVDAPVGMDGIDADTLADVSRAISKAMDQADPIDSEYLLEVSTPGAERELTLPKHWAKQAGRLAQVKLRDGDTVVGRVQTANDEAATLDIDGKETTIAYAQMKKARARVEFGSMD
ncbi:ribosome maturation factor RimP [Schaalia vaccimaxillae]|uniref:ribosome maturation factor RimP n=1 Tax=Schaalia vaccimaxillae TaxID=183916 RepID=UPI0003B397B5|nr:ribosome assembly cofactor RimP [Schaalia vaccimaxillae]